LNYKNIFFFIVFFIHFNILNAIEIEQGLEKKKIAYIVSDIKIPFWKIMSLGIQNTAQTFNFEVEVYSSNNDKKREIQNTVQAIKDKVDAIILSPINSSSAVTILKFAKSAKIPVVISDIGADKGEYLSFISSNNEEGAYNIAQILTQKMHKLGWDKNGSIGIVAIPQKRANGKARTVGFIKGVKESGIKISGLKQQVDFSYEETYNFSKELIEESKNLKAIWLQGSNRYKAALDAIKDTRGENEILLIVFDAEPEFLELIPKGVILGAAMQQPYLFGQKAVSLLNDFFNHKDVTKNLQLSILAISTDNIQTNIPLIKRNVLGIFK